MIESELVEGLRKILDKAQKPDEILETIDTPDFPKKFFTRVGEGVAYDVLVFIYEGLTVKDQELCSIEKAIVKEIRSWSKDNISDNLKRLRGCFLESDLR